MANAVGIVKQVSGTVVAIDAQGNQRVLRVGDEIMLGEVVHTQGSDSSVVVSMNNGKEFTLLGDDTIKIDQSVAQVESFGAEAFADASALQQAILAGDDLSKLEETAAGGAGGGGGSTGGGVSLAAGVFETGGHESNISANFENLSGSSQGNGGIYNDAGVGGGISGANRNQTSAQALDTTPPFVTINVEDGNSATPTITGAIEPNASAVIQIKDANGAVVDTINLTPAQTANGTYSVTPSHPLATDGDYTATIVATDAAGNSSVPVSDGFNIDTTAPVVSNVVVTNTDTNTPADGTPDETKVKFKVDDPTATVT
ncbi:MAG: retention module-containing protein, partial [Campylobacter curvus]